MAMRPATPLIVAPMMTPARSPLLTPVLAWFWFPGSVDREGPSVAVCVADEDVFDVLEDVDEEEEEDDDEDDDDDVVDDDVLEDVVLVEEEDVVFEDVFDEVFVSDVDVVAVNVPVNVTRSLVSASVDFPEAVAATLWPKVLAEPHPYW